MISFVTLFIGHVTSFSAVNIGDRGEYKVIKLEYSGKHSEHVIRINLRCGGKQR